ncbi:MAG: hypothetical protein DYG93_10245 [Leptolyngbya sp. PLA2]|nr:hypothetical protein [Leptolyngbya sp.]MCE7972023.1 hypothetical protein [Leptolyngbya sp. PL-A2]MCQ3940957.1 hypothetical protein [cyanobacterium CYA1]MCZ7634006.1 hypothetical protein [Phycisphaerales bacterium]MDL1905269.1 hypothetical protein [Synechococcales cyanobacterium CNB]GIK19175.1 MAG: hypothetical protein BroJett004_13390 [Planctomycetota bacterium]
MAKPKTVVLGALLCAMLAACAIGVLWTLKHRGTITATGESLQDYLGRQVVGIVNAYLHPQLGFSTVRYDAPGTLVLSDVTLTAPDGTRVLELERMTLTLAEVPRLGQPIMVERVELEAPTVRLVRAPAGPDGERGWIGLDPMVRAVPGRDDTVAPEFRLSNVLRLRRVELRNAAVTYDENDGSPPMILRGIEASLDLVPEARNGEAGWYTVQAASRVGHAAEFEMRGTFSLDRLVADIERLRLTAAVAPDAMDVLPPQVQSLLKERDARGSLEALAWGRADLNDPFAGPLTAQVMLREFNLAAGRLRLPIDEARAEATVRDGIGTLAAFEALLLDGQVQATGAAQLRDAAMPAALRWSADRLDLNTLLRSQEDRADARLAGRLRGEGTVTLSLDAMAESIGGAGSINVENGRLLLVPGITQLADAMNIARGVRDSRESNHRASASFTLTPSGVNVTASEVVTNFMAARGTGRVGYDGSMDLAVNAGPLERVQSLLGRVGEAIGSVTDRLMKYLVRGTVKEPRVTVAPLGIG